MTEFTVAWRGARWRMEDIDEDDLSEGIIYVRMVKVEEDA